MVYPKHSEERRTLTERRQFSYTAYVPERRSGSDRREARRAARRAADVSKQKKKVA